MSLSKSVHDYLQNLEERQYSEQTIKRRLWSYRQYLKLSKVLNLKQIRRLSERFKHIPSRHAVLSDLRSLASFMEERKECKEGFSLKIILPRKIKQLPKIIYSQEEIKERLDSLPENTEHQRRAKLLCFLLYNTGIRIGEALNIKMDDIDLENKRLWIRQGKGKKDRVCPITDDLINKVKKHLNTNKSLYLFNYKNQALSRKNISSVIRKHFPEGFTAHHFRHHLAVHLLENGADVRYIQVLLGHEEIKTTMIYLDITKENLKKAYRNITWSAYEN